MATYIAMKLSKFKFNLPEELIALEPTKFRDESRMMVIRRRTGEIEHRVFQGHSGVFRQR